MNRTELFLEKYKELESAAVAGYNMPPDGRAVSNLERRPEFNGIRAELAYCREVRNLLSHKERIHGSFAVEPSEAMIELLQKTINRVKFPVRLKDIAVMRDDILKMHLEDGVMPAMQKLKERGISHAPIMEGKRVRGVFSISTAFSIILSGREITPRLTFAEIKDIIDIDAHETEEFVFMRPEDRLFEAEELCEKFSKKHKRIGLILLTSDGSREGSLLGILTPWNVVSAP